MSSRRRTVGDQAPGDFARALIAYVERLVRQQNAPIDAKPEDQLKTPVGELIVAFGRSVGVQVEWLPEVRDADVLGWPDLGILAGGLVTGHIELKAPGITANADRLTGENRKQWERFKRLPNLIYTNGSDWNLYRSGELVREARLNSRATKQGASGLSEADPDALAAFFHDFLAWNPIVPTTARGLAAYLAPFARLLRDDVERAVSRKGSALSRVATEWRDLLFPGANDAQFADAYAQTVTYALLLAKFEGASSLRPAIAVDRLRQQHTLLAEALNLLEHPDVRAEAKGPIELLERVIEAVDSIRLRRDGDPWLYFYEDFLHAYDPKLQRDRGVYYTPVEVVRAQVRLAGAVLRTRFGKPLGFADDQVVVLDPAVGTGTYPLAVIDQAEQDVRDHLGAGAVRERMQGFSDRLFAFELLVGPYSVAHLRLSQRLLDAAGTLPKDGVHVYLADTLDSPYQPPQFQAGIFQQRLSDEHTRAQVVKRDVKVLVCLGNPPYDREEHEPAPVSSAVPRRKGGWVRYGDPAAPDDAARGHPYPILDDFIRPVREAGHGVHLKNLYNDYVYFWRWALWKVFETPPGPGIVTFITASSYLRGPAFAGMRHRMRQDFDELWIIDLEGGNLGPRKTENVFDQVQSPVAIAVGVRFGAASPETPARVWKTKVTGSSAEKLARLGEVADFDDFDWRECSNEWAAPFYPTSSGSYSTWPALTDIFPWQHSGVQMKRSWPIAETRQVLEERWRVLLQARPNDRSRLFKETRDRQVIGQYPGLLSAKARLPNRSLRISVI